MLASTLHKLKQYVSARSSSADVEEQGQGLTEHGIELVDTWRPKDQRPRGEEDVPVP